MRRLATWAGLIFALNWVGACTVTAPADNSGAGFELLTPSPQTREFIISNDVPFARQIVSHNRTCRSLPACRR